MTTLMVKHCKKHGAVERNKDGVCKKCNIEKTAKYRAKHREKAIETSTKWNKENPEKAAENKDNWQKKNKKYVSEIHAKWRKENPFSDSTVKQYITKLKPYFSLDLTILDIPPELVEIKRLQMQLYHAIKTRQTGEKL